MKSYKTSVPSPSSGTYTSEIQTSLGLLLAISAAFQSCFFALHNPLVSALFISVRNYHLKAFTLLVKNIVREFLDIFLYSYF
jgi:hypothetical protein